MDIGESVKLFVTFKLSTDGQTRVKRASRIKLDGRGSLVLFDSENGAETIELRTLQSLSIQPVSAAHFPAAAFSSSR